MLLCMLSSTHALHMHLEHAAKLNLNKSESVHMYTISASSAACHCRSLNNV